MNGVQDMFIRAGGILNADLSTEVLGPKKSVIVQHISAQTSYTFSGLDGNADYGYELTVMGSIATGMASAVEVRPNGVTTSMTMVRHFNDSSLGHAVHTVASTGLEVALPHTTPCVVNGHIQIAAKTGVGSFRSGIAHSTTIRDSDGYTYDTHYASRWSDVTTNITSLVVYFGTPAFTGWVSLRKLAEA